MNDKPKRKPQWEDVETVQDPDSGITLTVTQRKGKGKREFNFSFYREIDGRRDRFIPLPTPGAKHDVEHIVFSLAKRAREIVEAKLAEAPAEVANSKPREARKEKPRKGGLSSLAKADAEAKGFDFVGPSAKKRKRKKGAA